jgi:transcription antitermination factor NusG
LLTRPQCEGNAVAWLAANGVEAWYPTELRWKARAGRRVQYRRRIAPGYLFALFAGAPRWPVLFGEDPGARWLRGVVGAGGRPLPISAEAMAEVEGLPQRLLASRAEMRARAAEAARVRAGDRVRVADGPLRDWVVEVAAVHAGVARLVVPLLGGDREVSCEVQHLARVGEA